MQIIKKYRVPIIAACIIIIIIVTGITVFFLNRNGKEKIIGTVIERGNGYAIIEGETEDYILESKEYEIGSVLEIEILEYEKNTTPKIIKKSNTITLEEQQNAESFMNGTVEITMDEKMENKAQNENSQTNTNDNIKKEEGKTETLPKVADSEEETTTSKDEIVMAYFDNTERSFNNNDENAIKQAFVTTVDFLFYNGSINGVRLNDITTKTKLFVLKYALKLDAWIDKKIPNYKESISKTTNRVYTGIKNKIIATYLDTTAKICGNNPELCVSAKNDFQSMKTSFGITWDLIKTLASSGTTHLKEWYEIWSNK